MKNKELETLTEEIRKLREEVKALREAGGWFRMQYIPQPVYVPYYPQWWGTLTAGGDPFSYNIANDAEALKCFPNISNAGPEIDLGSAL